MTRPPGVDVLLLAFSRPDLLAAAVAPLQDGPVRRIFLALDGPRPGRPDDEAAIDACERLVRASFEADVAVEVLRRDRNLGMKRACVEAIDWFFGRTDEGIIIEEDCVVDPTFLPFAAALLERHREDDRIMGICGALSPGAPAPPDGASYSFVRSFGVWGWATWERAWRMNDADLIDVTGREIRAVLRAQPGTSFPFRRFWTHLVTAGRDGRNPSWSFPWRFSVWRSGGVFIRPDRNLVSNIGHDERATQTTFADPRLSRIPTAPIRFPLRHPTPGSHDVAYDRWSDRSINGIGWPLLVKATALKVAPWLRHWRAR